ncbi:MAG: hypothetical protein SNH13_07005 [Rikenellaceae bacterium]
MSRETYAAIDIGSNAIRLLVNYVSNKNDFKKAAFIRVPLRLGEDVFNEGAITPEKCDKLCEAMSAFSAVMKTFDVKSYRACATSAMREARNGADIVNYINHNCGVDIDIISGQEEARLIFEAGDIANLTSGAARYLFVDVGGGSTEVTLYSDNKRVVSDSFPLGTVRMITGKGIAREEMTRFKEWLESVVLPHKPTVIVGSGGNISKIHKLLSKKDGESFSYVELKVLYTYIKDMSYDERINCFGLNPYRADVIVPAMKIFSTVAKCCRINEIIAPRIGLAEGIIHHLSIQKRKLKL